MATRAAPSLHLPLARTNTSRLHGFSRTAAAVPQCQCLCVLVVAQPIVEPPEEHLAEPHVNPRTPLHRILLNVNI